MGFCVLGSFVGSSRMALFRRRDVTQAFRNNRHLQQFMLTDVTPTGKILGTGSYGSVEEVSSYIPFPSNS